MTDASWTFPDELRLAITGEPWSSARLSVQPTRLTALEERFETSRLPDWPVYTPQDVSRAVATDAAPDTFALWTAPLKADMAKYCPGRTTLSRLLSTITSAGYFLVDALADADNHSTVIVLSRDKQLTSGTTSQFFINGQRFVLTFAAPGDVMRTKSLLSQNFYENYMLESISENYSGGSIIDVGANIGNHSVFFGSIVTNGVVHAVEPGRVAYDLLERNLAANGVASAVLTYRFAAGDIVGDAAVGAATSTNLGAMKVLSAPSGAAETVKMMPLDSILDPEEVISVVKIDVEGFEIKALRGLQGLLDRQSPSLYIEAKRASDVEALLDVLGPQGYRSVACFNDTPTHLFRR